MRKCDQCLTGKVCKHRHKLLIDVEGVVVENISTLNIPEDCKDRMIEIMTDTVLEQCGLVELR